MKWFKTLCRVRPKSFIRLVGLALWHPLYLIPTFLATKNCMAVATEQYGFAHYQNGPANAFRHAYWNFLIAFRCWRWRPNKERALRWVKAITDWHEDAFFSTDLARMMDEHNNEIGRHWAKKLELNDEEQAAAHFMAMAVQSVLIDANTDLEPLKYQMVHIHDET